ncbi:MAG: hypothetical protein FJ087_02540 [Deltaproteobacteria bacterium]|nr:hypothetical protein [Deltaproteobacteria bacterium]
MRLPAAAVALLVAVLPASARADRDDGDRVEMEALVSGLGGAIHREWAGGFDAFGVLRWSRFRAALGAPMRFDRTGLRRADWDEPADFGRIVGEVAWGDPGSPGSPGSPGNPGDLVAARLGTIADLTLGTGAVVSGFRSTLDPDHWRTGATLAVHAGPAGGDAFVDSVIAPAVAAGRLYLRPFDPIQPGGFFGRLELGGTFAGDVAAPESYVRAPPALPGGAPGPVAIGPAGLPETRDAKVWAAAADLRWPVVRSREAEVTPYVAYVSLVDASGVHAGIDLSFVPAKRFRFGLAGEWRRLWSGNVAGYFDAAYAIDRYDLRGEPQAALLDRLDSDRWGMMAGASFEWAGGVRCAARLDLDRDGRASAFRADATVAIDRVRAAAMIAMKGFETASDFADPDRLLAAVSVEVRIVPVLAWFATYARDAAVATGGGPDRGRYLPSDTALTGLRFGVAR